MKNVKYSKCVKYPVDGKVCLIGAGPGDPEMITVKGLRILRVADVVIFDYLVSKEILRKAPSGALLINAGKRPGRHILSQDRINELLYRHAKQGSLVVRLKGGDPYVFGRGGEEAIFLRERGIRVEVIPGVTSAIAVPALAGIPVTQRHVAMTVAFASGHVTTDNDPIPIPDADTLVYVMCVTDLEMTVTRLMEKRGRNVPCAVIENGTLPSERIIIGDLSNIMEKVNRLGLSSPAVFVVGDVVGFHEKIFRKRILVTGTRADRFHHRGDVTYCPLVKICSVRSVSAITKAVAGLSRIDWVLFTSQHAVDYFLRKVNRSSDTALLRSKNILAIGPATADALKSRGFKRVLEPQNYHSAGVLNFLKKYDLRGKRILIPRSSLASDLIPKGLRSKSAHVTCVTVYRNIKVKPTVSSLDGFHEIIFTCPSAVRNFFHYFHKIPGSVQVFSIGPVTQEQLKIFGIRSEILDHER